MIESVVVRVPGSTSNLGAGFDCIGMAVDRWLTVTVRRDQSGNALPRLVRHGTLEALAAETFHTGRRVRGYEVQQVVESARQWPG